MRKFGLRQTVLAVLSSVFGMMFLGFYLAFDAIVLNSFRELESDHARQDAQRVLAAIDGELAHLDRFLLDWSSWDDAYEFAQGGNPSFAASNLIDDLFTDQHLYLFSFIGLDEQALWSRAFDDQRGRTVAFDVRAALPPAARDALLAVDRSGAGVRAVVPMAVGPVLLAARPILTSGNEFPAAGILIVGRRLDHDLRSRLARQTGVEFKVYPASLEGAPEEFREYFHRAGAERDLVFHTIDSDDARVFASCEGIDRSPALFVEIRHHREIMTKGRRAVTLGLASFFVVGVVTALVVSGLLGKKVVRPIQQLTSAVTRVDRSPTDEAFPLTDRANEIGALARAFQDAARRLDTRDRMFLAIGQSARDLIVMIDDSGAVIYWSRAGETLLGYSAEETLGRDLHVLIAPKERHDDFRTAFQEFRQTGTGAAVGRTIEFTALHKDGHEVPVELSLSSVRLQDRWNAVGVIRDVTERKKNEEELRKREERLRLALAAANQGLYDLNLTTGEADVNEEYARMLGYDPTEFHETNAAWLERLHPDDRERVEGVFRGYMAGDLPEYRVEFRQKTRSGDWKWIMSLGRIVAWDERGNPLRMLGTHTDMTERKQAELALQESERRLQSVFRVAPTGIGVVRHRVLLEANAKVCEMTGYREDELIGQSARMLYPSDEEFEFVGREKYRQISERGFGAVETKWRRKDGEIIAVLLSSTPMYPPDLSRGVIFTALDLTEQKKATGEKEKLQEQLRQSQKMESIGRLAGGVAHDFNNLLTCILGNTEFAMNEVNPGDPLYSDLEEVKGAAERAAALTSQLLAFSRKQVIAPRVVDLNDLLIGATRMVKRLIGEDIELEFVPERGLNRVKIDPNQMEQVLVNLAVNARDAMPKGGRLTIHTSNEAVDESYNLRAMDAKPGHYVRLTVSDTGVGIPPEVVEHIFEPFFTTKDKGKGTGLGLSMVYGAVKQNGGFIRVYSETGVGTVMKIYIPRFEGEVEHASRREPPAMPVGTETVLLVEDEDIVRSFTRKILLRQGYQVVDWDNGENALNWALKPDSHYDVLLTDVIMPVMNGRRLYENLKVLRPNLRVLFMSGYTEDVIAHHGVLDDDTKYIQKPFSAANLVHKIRDVIDGRA